MWRRVIENPQGDDVATGLVEWSGVLRQPLAVASLYVVALPIGNAADLTLRAWRVLRDVDAIAAEDTRTTRPLLQRYRIATPVLAAHRHNERAATQAIVERLQRGERIALVTDAGTPAISDPGALIVRAVHEAGFGVFAIPGPSSVAAALSIAGVSAPSFAFLGFLPTGAREREATVRTAVAGAHAVVLLEAPHRIRALADLLRSTLSADREIIFARELTKKFETVQRCRAGELSEQMLEERGEYVVIIDRAAAAAAGDDVDVATQRWLAALLDELPPARAAAVAARASGHPKHALYALAIQLKPHD